MSVCAGTQGVQYYTESNMSNYVWSVIGGTIVGANNSNVVTVNWGFGASGIVSVNYSSNGCTAAAATNATVTINVLPVPGITGEAFVCAGQTSVIYTTQSDMSNYSWSVSGGTITAGLHTNEITVTWGTGSSGTVSVNYTDANGCTAAVVTNYSVTINVLPTPTISGLDNVCQNASGVTYTTQGSMSSYNWTVTGGTITAGAGTNVITVTWGTGSSGTVSVNYTNANGCTAASATNYSVTIHALPVPSISGSMSVCDGGSALTYSTDPNMSAYVWTISGGNIIGGGNTNQVTVTWNSGITAGVLTVNYTNANGCTAAIASSYDVAITALPVPTITGSNEVCTNQPVVPYVTEPGKTGYFWTVSGGTLVSGGTTDRILVNWGSGTAGEVTVIYTDGGCAPINPTVLPVTIGSQLMPGLSGPFSSCVGNELTYTTDAGMNTYVWTIPADATVVAGGSATDNTVTLSFATQGSRDISVTYISGSCPASVATRTVQVYNLPAPNISGLTIVCANQTNVTYNTEPGMNNYQWSVSGGTVVNGGGTGSSSVTVDWGTGTSGTVSVNYSSNGCTAAAPTVLNVTINTLPTPTITSVSGSMDVCAGAQGVQYYTESEMSDYVWTVIGGTIVGANNNSVVTVNWGTGTSGRISVNYAQSGCGAGLATEEEITIYALPTPGITGQASVCAGASAVTYTTQSNMSNYQWSVSGGTVTAGLGTNQITVTWGTGASGNVSVNYTNANGCTATSVTNFPVTINALPVPTISGNASVCQNASGVVYTTQASMNNYTWIVTGGTITGGAGTGSITVTWGTGASGSVSVNYENANGCAATSAITHVIINTLPVPVISGLNSVCVNASAVVYTTASNMSNYVWTVTGGTIVSGNGSNSITVNWGAGPAGEVTVSYTNASGCTAASATVYPVSITPLPIPTITGPLSVCSNAAGMIYYTEDNMSNYTWTITGGSIIGGAGSTVTVNWGAGPSGSISVNYITAGQCTAVVPTEENITISTIQTPSITGNANTCQNQVETYRTDAGMSNYQWAVGGGATIISGGTTADDFVTVSWSTSGSKTVSILYTGGGCPTTSNSITVDVNTLPVPNISGNALVCENLSGEIYSTDAGMSNYVWTIVGGTVTTGGGAIHNTVTVTWDDSGTGSVSVNYTNGNGCTAASATQLPVTIKSRPVPTISGNLSVCANANEQYFTETGMSGYLWSVLGGSIISGQNTRSIIVNWFNGIIGNVSVNYISDGCLASGDTEVTVSINALPVPGIIGSDNVCANQTSVTYTTQGNMSNYVWTVTGGNITSGLGTEEITVTWGSGSTGNVSVNYTNANGCSAASATNFPVTINALPIPTISGNISVCQNASGVLYTTEAGMNNYNWIVSGGIITSGAGSNVITVTWGAGVLGTVSVNYETAGGCTAAFATTQIITINALPVPVISGSANICEGASGVNYFTESSMSNYVWTVSGGTIASNNGSNITVNWDSGITSGLLSVSYTNASGCTAVTPTTYSVNIHALPEPTILGAASVCANSTNVSYSTEANMSNYVWTVSGGTIVSPSNVSTILVNWGNGVFGELSVNYTTANGCRATLAETYGVTINALPVPTINGNATVCANESDVVYYTEASMFDYTWAVNGGIITGGAGTNVITVTWASGTSGSVSVNYTNMNGCRAVSPTVYAVSMNPETAITVQPVGADICSTSSLVLTVEATGTAPLTYQWKNGTTPVGTNSTSYTATTVGDYTVEVTGACGATVISNVAGVTFKAAVAISTQPVSAVICPGETTPLSVMASGVAPLSYQWRLGGVAISGATAANYSAGAAGIYTVEISDACGTNVISESAVVTLGTVTQVEVIGSDVCIGSDVTFIAQDQNLNVLSGGVWRSDNPMIAVVDASTGVVTGLSIGSFTIVYHYTDTCGNISNTEKTYQTHVLPTVTVIDRTVCAGTSVPQSDLVGSVFNGNTFRIYTSQTGGSLIPQGNIIAGVTTTYYVEGVNTNSSCVSAARIPVTLTVIPDLNNLFTVEAAAEVCPGGSIDLRFYVTVDPSIADIATVLYFLGDDPTPLGGSIVTPPTSHTLYYVQLRVNNMCFSVKKPIFVDFSSGDQNVIISGQTTYCVGQSGIVIPSQYAANGVWSSDNPTIAEVNQQGVVTAHSAGITSIRYSFVGLGRL
jgi:hypothetical protein